MDRHNSQLKAPGVDLFAQPYRDAHLLTLAIDHMKHGLEDKYVLFLHFLNLELKLGSQFGAIFELWELYHLALLNVNLEAARLVDHLLGRYLFTLLLRKLRDGVQKRHQVKERVDHAADAKRQLDGAGLERLVAYNLFIGVIKFSIHLIRVGAHFLNNYYY